MGIKKSTNPEIELLKDWERRRTTKERKGLQKYSGTIQLKRGNESLNLIEENTRNFEITIISYLLIHKTWLNL